MELFARLETDGFSGSNVDFRTGSGIASDAGFAGPDAEDAESAELNAVARRECLFEAFEDGIDCRFGLGARQAGALDDMVHDILLDQCRRPCLRWKRICANGNQCCQLEPPAERLAEVAYWRDAIAS